MSCKLFSVLQLIQIAHHSHPLRGSVEGRVSDTLSHDPFAARKKQQVETTRVTPNLVLRRVKEGQGALLGEESIDRIFPSTELIS